MSKLKSLQEEIGREAREKGFDKPPTMATDSSDASDSNKPTPSKSDMTTAEKLMDIIGDVEFFNDRAGTGWARVEGGCYPVRSTAFKRRLQRIYYQRHGKTPHSQATQDVLDQATGIALFDSPTQNVNVRVAISRDCIVVDRISGLLTIGPQGWESGSETAENFWQPQGLNELPMPEEGGDGIDLLRKYLNYETKDDFRLMVAWILAAYNPEIACPIMIFQGEQGTAKSTNSKVMRSLIDPSGAMINPAPRDERELIIQAQNSRILCLDNLSGLKKWLSDAICRICTGTGFSTRRLYTNDEQQIFQVKRPIILNGIDDIATRGDLLDRSIVLTLPAIDPADRRDEREFWHNFRQDCPSILAALYDALAAGLSADRPELQELPRMADFAEWVTRCEDGLDWGRGDMLAAYNLNKDNAIEAGLDGDYLGSAIRKILDEQEHFEGTATDLVERIRTVAADVNEKYLPTTRTLKSRLTRIGPALRTIGITWEYKRTGADGSRTYVLDKDQEKVSELSEPSENGGNTDATDTTDSSNGTLSEAEFNKRFESHQEPPF